MVQEKWPSEKAFDHKGVGKKVLMERRIGRIEVMLLKVIQRRDHGRERERGKERTQREALLM